MPRKASHSTKSRKGCSKMLKVKIIKGGDASEHAIAVYGGIGQQHAATADTNVIAVNAVGSPSPLVNTPAQTGGNAPLEAKTSMSPVTLQAGGNAEEQLELENSNLKGGESVLADLAVPAVLLVANQAMMKRHRKSGKKSRKYRKKSVKRIRRR